MKKILTLLLCFTLIFSVGCGGGAKNAKDAVPDPEKLFNETADSARLSSEGKKYMVTYNNQTDTTKFYKYMEECKNAGYTYDSYQSTKHEDNLTYEATDEKGTYHIYLRHTQDGTFYFIVNHKSLYEK